MFVCIKIVRFFEIHHNSVSDGVHIVMDKVYLGVDNVHLGIDKVHIVRKRVDHNVKTTHA